MNFTKSFERYTELVGDISTSKEWKEALQKATKELVNEIDILVKKINDSEITYEEIRDGNEELEDTLSLIKPCIMGYATARQEEGKSEFDINIRDEVNGTVTSAFGKLITGIFDEICSKQDDEDEFDLSNIFEMILE